MGLPSHVDNVALHKGLGLALVSAIDESLVADVQGRLHWTLHAQGQGPVRGLGQGLAPGQGLGQSKASGPGLAPQGPGLSKASGPGLGVGPLVVLLHGWMGNEADFNPLIEQLGKLALGRVRPGEKGDPEGGAPLPSYDILTVDR